MDTQEFNRLVDYTYQIPAEVLESITRVNTSFVKALDSQLKSLIPIITTETVKAQLDIIKKIPFDIIRQSVELLRNAAVSAVVPKALDELSKSFEYIANYAPIVEAVKAIQNQISQLPTHLLSESYNQLSEVLKGFEEAKEVDQEYSAIMIRAGWPPVLDLTYSQIHVILTEYRKGDFETFKTELDEALISFYDELMIRNKLEKWKKIEILSRRYAILDQIVDAHLSSNYFLSVPVMIIQIEGVLGDIYKHIGKLKLKHLQEYLRRLFENQFSDTLKDGIRKYIIAKIFANFQWGSPIESEISRHAIVHGACTDYGNELNSLKAIILFDYIVNNYERESK